MVRKVTVFSLLLLVSCPAFITELLAQQCIVTKDAVRDFSKASVLEFFIDSDGFGTSFSEWHRSIREAQAVNIFNVSGHVPIKENIIKADTVIFTEGSVLEFLDVDAPFWAIVAKDLKFQGGNITITRNTRHVIPTPKKAANGSDGRKFSEDDRNCCKAGESGENGTHGKPGKKGGSKNLPCFLVFTQSLELVNSSPDNISVRLAGIAGGRGGDGGKGGNGKLGQAGAHASFRPPPFKCRREPQDGGGGGNAGNGGHAGHGGRGGNGGDVLFVGNQNDGVTFMSFKIFNEGGSGGDPGNPGRSGKAGEGGDRGHRNNRPCFRKADKGRPGFEGHPGHSGNRGAAGSRGLTQIVVVGALPYW